MSEIARVEGLLGQVVAGLGLAWLGWMALHAITERKAGVKPLETFYRAEEDAQPVPIGSRAYKIRLALGARAAGREQAVLYAAYAAAGVALLALGVALALPLWIALLLAVAGAWMGVNGFVESRWNASRRKVEADLPMFLRNLGGMMLVTPNVLQALQDTVASLDARSPLRAWMTRLIEELRLHGQQGFERMQDEAQRISPQLLLVVVEVGRLWETGGAQFAQAFYQAASNQTKILSIRNNTEAELAGAKSTLRVILLTLGGAVYMSIRIDPAPFNTAIGRIGLLAVAGLAAVGWLLLQRMMDDVLS